MMVDSRTAPNTIGVVTHANFFLSTKAIFIECDQPKVIPDYISEGGSCYWHGADENGLFVIRQSDHWCQYYVTGLKKMKRFRSRIRSCNWNIIMEKGNGNIDIEIKRSAKCYLKDFKRIIWKSKRRYVIL